MMKLYVWEDFACDWTCGLTFAIARTKQEAIETIIADYGKEGRRELENTRPRVYTLKRKSPIAFAVSGGG